MIHCATGYGRFLASVHSRAAYRGSGCGPCRLQMHSCIRRYTMNSRAATGRWGEDLAVAVMHVRGWSILHRNWRPKTAAHGLRGELDIIARENNSYVACEVKTRSTVDFGHPLEAIDENKARRLCLLANAWAVEEGIPPSSMRIDAIAVIGEPNTFSFEHRIGVV